MYGLTVAMRVKARRTAFALKALTRAPVRRNGR